MRYIHVRWHHDFRDDPVEIYIELDADNWETRKVEIFSDGRASFADTTKETGLTWLSEKSIPPLNEINSSRVFDARDIDQSEFEAIWDRFVTSR